MKNFEVKVGGFYVGPHNRTRHVVREVDAAHVIWVGYNTLQGDATGDGDQCAKTRIRNWAQREATPEEAARMQAGKIVPKEERSG